MRSFPTMSKGPALALNFVFLMLICLPWQGVRAYEVGTHATITEHAFNTALTKGNLGRSLTDLGLSTTTVLQDPTSTIGIPKQLPSHSGEPLDWIREGSRYEDDGWRPLNHFYDPVHFFHALCSGIIPIPGYDIPSSSWGLAAPGTLPNQQWSYHDARKYFINGLTLSTKQERDSNLAKTFRALGQVMHLIQDKASPQHVRNDAHNPDVGVQLLASLTGCATSSPLYESFIDLIHLSSSLIYDGYSPPNFQSPQDFWETGGIYGRGLAEFTNLNFVSEGTNFNQLQDGATDGSPGLHPFPQLDLSMKSDEDIRSLLPFTTYTGVVTFYRGIVSDNLNPSGAAENFRLTTHSIFDRDLLFRGYDPIFALNSFNYIDHARLLLPRAVGYSAGLLNYFFRASMDADIDANDNVIVKNSGNEAMAGTFTLFYDDSNGNRKGVLSGQLTIAPNGNSSLGTLVPPTTPAPKEPGKYIIVFQGKMGMENDAVAGRIVSLVLKHKLEIKKSGNGSGNLDSVPQGMTCDPTTCWAEFEAGTAVDIKANADQGSTFSGWSGDCNGSSPTFSIVMDGDKTCEALFERPKLTLSRIGSGSGSIVSLPSGIDCGATCQSDFDVSSVVRLTAKEDKGSRFAGWEGDCAAGGSTPTVDVIMTGDKSCTARFDASQVAVRLNPYGSKNYSEGPFRVEVVDDSITPTSAQQDVTVTLLRQVFSQCRGLLFSSNRTVIVPQGQVSTSYDFTAGPDPFCNTLPIRTELTITGATLGSNTPLDLSNVPSAQRKIGITR
ncbi:hypothetical protein [Geobacter sp.]|uniref:InlB B-repeat-containing protein n=1 Tax=Geobacter sp. TaxID=46610 RepID=UPI0027B97E79|nr:hypothetical protein [Geobacter sp.]